VAPDLRRPMRVTGHRQNCSLPVHREILLKDGPRLDEGRSRAASREAVVAAGRGKIAEELDTLRLYLSRMSKDLREATVQRGLVGGQ